MTLSSTRPYRDVQSRQAAQCGSLGTQQAQIVVPLAGGRLKTGGGWCRGRVGRSDPSLGPCFVVGRGASTGHGRGMDGARHASVEPQLQLNLTRVERPRRRAAVFSILLPTLPASPRPLAVHCTLHLHLCLHPHTLPSSCPALPARQSRCLSPGPAASHHLACDSRPTPPLPARLP